MTDTFVFLKEDLTEFIKTEQDVIDFERMVELAKGFHRPVAECWQDVMECENIRRRLKGDKPLIIIPINKDGKDLSTKHPTLN